MSGLKVPLDRDLAIIGYGQRGQAWVRKANQSGWSVRVFDPEGALEAGHARIVQYGLISTAVQGAAMVVLCLPDRLALQRKIIQHVQTMCPPTTLLLVMSDVSDAEEIQGCVKWPEDVLHVRFGADNTALNIFPGPKNPAKTLARLEPLILDLGLKVCIAETEQAQPN